MRDLANRLHPLRGFDPVVVGDNTAQVSQIIDLLRFDGLCFVIATGVLADVDATFTVLVEHGDDSGLSDAAAVPDKDLTGTEVLAGFTFGDDSETRKIGYVGTKRFVRCTVTPAANAGNAPLACVAILGHPHVAPTANPPV